MKIIDNGVLPGSFMDFFIPSEFAQRALYFSTQFGHFVCDSNYRVERSFLDQYLLLYLCRGALGLRCGGESARLTENQIGLFDCRVPHSYWCEEKVDFYWFHFNGCSSNAYTAFLHERFGLVHSGSHIRPLRDDFLTVIQSTQSTLTNEHQISVSIHRILSGLATSDEHAAVASELLTPAIAYIHNHFAEDVPLDTLAACCGISKSHFIRTFQRYINSTPHEYLLLYRLRQAKRLLLSTDLTVERVAEQCGFNSASHFIRAFRQSTGITPTAFRGIGF